MVPVGDVGFHPKRKRALFDQKSRLQDIEAAAINTGYQCKRASLWKPFFEIGRCCEAPARECS